MTKTKPNVVVIGGGTGIYPVTTAIKHLDIDLKTIIGVSDNGGSTGKIRDEFGFQPVGDLRQSLAALAEGEGQEWIRKLLLYRFNKGNGLKGHNLGNLILTALQDMTGDTSEALFRAQQIFRLEGDVIPATKENVDIKIYYEDGTTDIGENNLNPEFLKGKKVDKVELTPEAEINPFASKAIIEADYIIIGPGDLYGSILSPLAPIGTKEAFAQSEAKIIYVSNLMTRENQTDNMTALDHLKKIEETIGRIIDVVIINNKPIPENTIAHYEKSHEYVVSDDMRDDQRVIRADIISDQPPETELSDGLSRSFLRHDSEKLQKLFTTIINQ